MDKFKEQAIKDYLDAEIRVSKSKASKDLFYNLFTEALNEHVFIDFNENELSSQSDAYINNFIEANTPISEKKGK